MTSLLATMRTLDATHGAVRVEDVYDTTIDDLWSAISDPARLARWLVNVDGEPRLGATVHAVFTSSWTGPVRIDVCEPPHRLQVTSRPGEDDETVTEAILRADGGRTRLIIEERGLALADLPGRGAGWQAHVEDLRRDLEGDPAQWKARWEELSPAYRALPVQ